MTGTADRLRLAPWTFAERWRHLRAGWAKAVGSVRPYAGRVPQRFLIVPPDLRTADPTAAADIYAGHFLFAGRLVSTSGRSPFDVEWPSEAWAEGLLGFAWLRHLRAAESALASANARALFGDFVNGAAARQTVTRTPRVVARRLVSLLSHSPLLLSDADLPFYRLLLKGITRDASYLMRLEKAVVGEDRIAVGIGLAFAGLCLDGADNFLHRGSRLLGISLDRQILPDGGHVGRNPATIVELLSDLLPLRQAYAARAVEPPAALARAIDRMMPMLRLFRHPDGTLALFNGAGLSQADLIATLLAYDDARGSAILHAPHAGYERLEAHDAVIIADVGRPPALSMSREAHAGALAFEMSTGSARIVVNCGAPRGSVGPARQLSRATAAHSTLVIGDTSSCRFASSGSTARAVIVDGPTRVTTDRQVAADGSIRLTANHDGYVSRFGLAHEREWRLAPGGDRLDGQDILVGEGLGQTVPATIRFHLHPHAKASRVGEGRTIMIVLGNGEAWSFESDAPEVTIEESVYFAGADGARRCEQIVLSFTAAVGLRVKWSFARIGRVRAAPKTETRFIEPDLPLDGR